MCKVPSVQSIHGGSDAEEASRKFPGTNPSPEPGDSDSALANGLKQTKLSISTSKAVRFHEKMEPGAPFPSDVSYKTCSTYRLNLHQLLLTLLHHRRALSLYRRLLPLKNFRLVEIADMPHFVMIVIFWRVITKDRRQRKPLCGMLRSACVGAVISRQLNELFRDCVTPVDDIPGK